MAPMETRAKTREKVLDALADSIDSKTAKVRVKIIGPHKSQFLRAVDCWDLSLNGKTTITRFR